MARPKKYTVSLTDDELKNLRQSSVKKALQKHCVADARY